MTNLVSVCLPNYNYGRFLADAIESVLAQTYQNFELIIGDNASTDESVDIARRYLDDPRVKLLTSEENLGMIWNFTRVAQEAKGEYCVFLCADDILLPRHLELTVARMEALDAQVDVVYGRAIFCDAALQPRAHRDMIGELGVAASGRNEFAPLMLSCYISFGAMLVRRSALIEVGYIDGRYRIAWDWAMYLALASRGKAFASITEPIQGIRVHEDQNSGVKNYFTTGEAYREYLKLLEDYLVDDCASLIFGYEQSIIRKIHEWHEQRGLPSDADDYHAIDEQRQTLLAKLEAFAAMPRPLPDKNTPEISVIVASDEQVMPLDATLQALAQQQGVRFEIIVVQHHGRSVRGVVERACRGITSRYIRDERYATPSYARFVGVDLARAGIMTYADAGTLPTPDHLATIVHGIRAQQAGIVVMPAEMLLCFPSIDKSGSRVSLQLDSNLIEEQLLIAPGLPLCAIAHTREALDRTGGMSNALPVLQGWELLLRARAAKEPIISLPDTTIKKLVDATKLVRLFNGGQTSQIMTTLKFLHQNYSRVGQDIILQRQAYLARLNQLLDYFERHGANEQLIAELVKTFMQPAVQSLLNARTSRVTF